MGISTIMDLIVYWSGGYYNHGNCSGVNKMSTPKITKEDVGSVLVDDKGKLFKVISFTARPTFTIEHVETKERQDFVVHAPITENLTKLIKEEK